MPLPVRARKWGYGRIEVRWLFGRPVKLSELDLAAFHDPIGPGTDEAIDELASCTDIVVAWSAPEVSLLDAMFWDRCWIVGRRLERLSGRRLKCIGHCDGYPAAPSMLRVSASKLQPFELEFFTFPPSFRGTPHDPFRPPPCA